MEGVIFMLSKYVRKLKIGQKILISTLLISLTAQITSIIPAIIGILSFSNDAQTESSNLGNFISKTSKESMENQSKTYLEEISRSMSDASDNIFEEISDEINSLCIAAEDIYKNPQNFKGHNLPMPELTEKKSENSRDNASENAYIVDPESISENGQYILAFNTSNKNLDNAYTLNPKKWKTLSNDEKSNLQKEKMVLSSNPVPNNLKKELYLISNLSHIAKSIYSSNEAVSSIYVGTESGICYHYSLGNSKEKYVPKARPWYKDAVDAFKSENNLPVWQSTYISMSDGVPCITCSKSFANEKGEILGTVGIDMHIGDINKYIVGTKLGSTSKAFVVDKNGEIIMHPDYNINTSEQENKNFIKNPLDSKETSESYKNLISKMSKIQTGVDTATINEKNYYVAYSPMVTPKWCLGIACESDEILSPISEIQSVINASTQNTENSIRTNLIKIAVRFFLIFLLCASVTYLIGIKLSKELSSPIKKLRNQAKIIGDGDFSSRIKVESEDELGDLSNSFNKMTENLISYMENLKQTTAEKEKIHSELMVAKKIQKSMLPCIFPAFPERQDFDIYALMDPAREVGGDFYDFFFTDKKHLALVIADVSGKGVSAALFMVIAKILIKNQLQAGDSPEKALQKVNKMLCENNEAGMFVTAFVGVIDITTGGFTFSNAGHNPPLIYKKESDEYNFIESPHGFVLGGIPDAKYSLNKTVLKPEDSLFLYTDGVTEAMNPEGELFSKERLQSILNNDSTKELKITDVVNHLRQEIDKFSDGAERSDDITMLAFKDFKIPQN